jgi:hypothetical protein
MVRYQGNNFFGVKSMKSFNLKPLSVIAAGATALCIGATMTPAQAANITSLSDNFNTENLGVGQLNYTGFANWNVLGGGTVDLVGSPGFFEFYPGNGLYVDLDGTSGNAGTFTTKSLFDPGQYQLSFKLGGSARGTSESVTVSFGTFTELFTRASSDPLNTVTRLVTLSSPGALSFKNAGGDNIGAILDDVNVKPIPTPALLPGLIGLGVGLLRKRKAIAS